MQNRRGRILLLSFHQEETGFGPIFLAGASAIQIGTANFVDPRVPIKIIQGLKTYGERHGLNHISELVGKLETENLERLL